MATEISPRAELRPADRLSTLRTMLHLAKPENSRMVAATIGHHLDLITVEAAPGPAIAEASDTVRDASLGFLTALHGRGDVVAGRAAALASIDHLAASLG